MDCLLWPLRVAVTMALWLLLTIPEAAVKVCAALAQRDCDVGGDREQSVIARECDSGRASGSLV